ncbi:MAG: DinB family protein [Terrimicrobiaceae bacterium]
MNAEIREGIPVLAPPGAGLPRLELIIMRLAFGWLRRRQTREQAAELFRRERDVILRLASRCDPESASRPVLIDRLRGMEDSSRFWSVFMVIDHLRIVNRGISEVIRLLGRGQTPARQLRIADVKPRPLADQKVTGEFEQACARFERHAAKLSDLRTALRYAHPWFGPLDASGWHFLAGFHMQLHRRQIELILRHLSPDRS